MSDRPTPDRPDEATNRRRRSDEPTPDDIGRLRHHLDAAVAAPVTDRWEEVRASVTGEGPTPVPLHRVDERPVTRRRLMVLVGGAAAAVVLLVGLVVAIGGRANDGDGDVGGPSAPAAEPTGFYVPGDLPEDWVLADVSTSVVDQALPCPCTFTTFRDDQGRSYLAVTGETDRPELWLNGDYEPLDGLDGFHQPGTAADEGTRAAAWTVTDDGVPAGSRLLLSSHLEESTFLDLAEGWGEDAGAAPPALDGFRVDDERTIPTAVSSQIEVRWTFERPDTPHRVTVSLSPDPFGDVGSTATTTEVTLPGNGLAVRFRDEGGTVGLTGSWPGGATIRADDTPADAGPRVACAATACRAAVEAVVSTFAPVDAHGWADHVAEAGVPDPPGPPTPVTATISDWLVPGPGPVLPGDDPDVPDGPDVTDPLCEADDTYGDLDDALLGLTVDEARGAAEDLGLDLRVIVVDGVGQAVTDDLRCDRVNVGVSDDRVEHVDGRY